MSLSEKFAAPVSRKKRAVSMGRSLSEVRVRLGVIGYGYWGPNLVRNFQDIAQSKVAAVADLDEKVLKSLAKKFADLCLTTRHREILRDPSIDAVVIATPVSTHYALASEALRFGKHVFSVKHFPLETLQGNFSFGINLLRGLGVTHSSAKKHAQ